MSRQFSPFFEIARVFVPYRSGWIEMKIRQRLVKKKTLGGVISMPSNIFATTDTNVSIVFIDGTNKGNIVLIAASALGEKIKEGKNQKTILGRKEEQMIFSLSAGQYFEVKISHVDISEAEFSKMIKGYRAGLDEAFRQRSRN
jgi:type I restriction enzyme M protein